MSKRTTQTDAIQSGKRTGISVPQEKITYGEEYTADDFDDNDLINKAAVIELVGDVPDAPTLADGVITPGVIEIDIDSLATFTTQFSYRLGGVVYDPVQPDLQLDDPDATFNRIDIIYGDNAGSYGFVTGVAASTQETPLPPAGTIMLAKILRNVNGTNVISIVGASGYVEQILGIMFGNFFIRYGSNIYFDSAEGTKDPGDLVWRKWPAGVLTESLRMYNETEDVKRLMLKFDGTFAKRFEVTHSGNRTPIPVADGDLVIDWQNDLVPDDPLGRTYVARYYNIIQDVINWYDEAGTIKKAYPEVLITKTGDLFDTVTINTLFAGTISIL